MTDDGLLLALAMTAKRVLEDPNAANRVALKMNVDEALKRVKIDTRAGTAIDRKRQRKETIKEMHAQKTVEGALRAGWEGGMSAAEVAHSLGKDRKVIERQLVAMQIADAGDIQRRSA